MPDQNAYSETVGALDALRLKAKKEQQDPVTTVSKFTPTPLPTQTIGLPQVIPGMKTVWSGNDPKEIAKKEAQYATLEKAAIKTQEKLAEAHSKYKDLLADGIDPHESDEAKKISDDAIRYRKQLEYFSDIAKELGKPGEFTVFHGNAKPFETLTSPKNAAIAQGFRQADIKGGK